MADAKNTTDKVNRLKVYAAGLKQRLSGQLSPELRKVIEIDLRKTESAIAKLAV
jgi:hypothetical protein